MNPGTRGAAAGVALEMRPSAPGRPGTQWAEVSLAGCREIPLRTLARPASEAQPDGVRLRRSALPDAATAMHPADGDRGRLDQADGRPDPERGADRTGDIDPLVEGPDAVEAGLVQGGYAEGPHLLIQIIRSLVRDDDAIAAHRDRMPEAQPCIESLVPLAGISFLHLLAGNMIF